MIGSGSENGEHPSAGISFHREEGGLDSYRIILLSLFCIILVISCISPPFPEQLLLQHIPTVIALLILVVTSRRFNVSRASFALILGFLLAHVIGARYIYSYVPYDEWAHALFGTTISQTFGFRRNHYDRLVHFLYGLLLAPVAREILVKRMRLSSRLASYFAIEFIMAGSMLYELAEWCIALLLSPEAAEGYNGQQGDMWDAQKDMALATMGSIVAISVGAIVRRGRKSPRMTDGEMSS